MSSAQSPYQPPAHVVQLSIQHINICATPSSYSANDKQPSCATPTALYPQSTPPNDKELHKEHIQKTFMSNLTQYRETCMAQPAEEKAVKKPTAMKYEQGDLNPDLHQKELSRHFKNPVGAKTGFSRGEGNEGHLEEKRKCNGHSKATSGSMRLQKRRSSKKGLSFHRKKCRANLREQNGDEE